MYHKRHYKIPKGFKLAQLLTPESMTVLTKAKG